MGRSLPGLELARRFHECVLRPVLVREFPRLRYDAALVGAGSEVLGFDDARSPDHDWGPRAQIFLAPGDHRRVARRVRAALTRDLSGTFLGWPVRWGGSDGGPVRHHVDVWEPARWSREYLGIDATRNLRTRDWLGIASQRLRGATSGEVFRDELGALRGIRERLRWYPADVWKYLLACQWNRIGQTEPFVGRTGEVGDDLGSRLVAAGLVRDVMRLAFLLERVHAPYHKWLGTAFAGLRLAPRLMPELRGVMRSAEWRGRERHLSRAYAVCVAAQNRLRMAPAQPGRVSSFHGRPFQVIHADRIAAAIRRAVRDPEVRSITSMAGSIDQISDATDVADVPALSRRIASVIR